MSNNYGYSKVIAATLILIGLSTAVLAQSDPQATPAGATAETSNLTAATNDTTNITIKAGRTVQLDVDQAQLTNKWAGFFGTISASKVLGDGSDQLYEWAAAEIPENAEVIATPKGQTVPTDVNNVSDPNAFLGSEYDSGVANASTTFSNIETRDVLGQTVTTSAVNTFDNTGTATDTFTTFLFNNSDTSTDDPVWVAEAGPSATGFRGNSVNYQLLVGVGENPSQKTFSFYLELP